MLTLRNILICQKPKMCKIHVCLNFVIAQRGTTATVWPIYLFEFPCLVEGRTRAPDLELTIFLLCIATN